MITAFMGGPTSLISFHAESDDDNDTVGVGIEFSIFKPKESGKQVLRVFFLAFSYINLYMLFIVFQSSPQGWKDVCQSRGKYI